MAEEKKQQENIALDDARRVKVLSPSMLVFKRFIRNRLAIVGFIILVVMFVFSFVGGLLSPYSQTQVFKKTEAVKVDYAGAIYNTELRYIVEEGISFPNAARSEFILAKNSGKQSFSYGDMSYSYSEEGENFYRIYSMQAVAKAMNIAKSYEYTELEEGRVTEDFKTAFETAVKEGNVKFIADNDEYVIERTGKSYEVFSQEDIALASLRVFDACNAEDNNLIRSFEFRYVCEKAIADSKSSFELNGETYTLIAEADGVEVYLADGTKYVGISNIIVNPNASDVTLSYEFKDATREAIVAKQDRYDYEGDTYYISIVNANYYIMNIAESMLIDSYAAPSAEHWLGLDGNGMDMLTRLMYGGRVSLIIGFVVIFIEMILGIIIGGISGYFGDWVDTALMRFVDLFNSIPFWPLCLIMGSVMDTLEIASGLRIFILMILLGVLGWTGIARVVRGQILTLREQDFMIATEATGISVYRRIFKHLVPNVMPLLIVQATMGLGGIILTEATLSFLGLGVKYPLASWGNIINAATDIYVMRTYWFIWVPAGLLILLSVLGFNFVGDGLRDAFDPKMKR